MNIDAIHQGTVPDLLDLRAKRSKAVESGLSPHKKLKRACQDFEAMFVGYVLKSMRKTVPEGGFIKKSAGERIYREMLDMEVASSISKNRGMGLADVLYNQLKKGY